MADPKDPKHEAADEAEDGADAPDTAGDAETDDDSAEAESDDAGDPEPDPEPEPDEPEELSEEEEFALLPGRPVGPDELDPELMKLSKPGARIGWLLSLSVVVLCGYVMLQIRADLSFSRESDEPTIIESATALPQAEPNSFVAVRAVPDRAYAARVLKSKSSMGQRLYPVFGTNDRVWLLIAGSPWDDKPVYSEIWAGRVRRIADLPFAESLEKFLSETPALPRFVPRSHLRKALAENATQVEHPSGDTIAVTGDTPVTVSELVRDRANVTVTRSERYPDESHWRAALASTGLISSDTQPVTGDGEFWTYAVSRDGGVSAVKAVLAEAKLVAEVEPVSVDHRGTWSQLSSDGSDVRIADESVAWDDVTRVSLSVKRTLPAEATVLVASEQPGDYWFVLPVFGILGAFAALFAWAFVLAVRREQPAA